MPRRKVAFRKGSRSHRDIAIQKSCLILGDSSAEAPNANARNHDFIHCNFVSSGSILL